MNKSTITTLFIGVGAAVALSYAMGFFDATPSSVSITVNPEVPTQQVVIETQPTQTVTADTVVAPTTTGTTQANTTPAAPQATSGITRATVAQHATRNDCWVIINSNVYDITSYIPEHRKAQRDVIASCGTDATTVFTDVNKHMRPDVQAALPSFLKGALQG